MLTWTGSRILLAYIRQRLIPGIATALPISEQAKVAATNFYTPLFSSYNGFLVWIVSSRQQAMYWHNYAKNGNDYLNPGRLFLLVSLFSFPSSQYIIPLFLQILLPVKTRFNALPKEKSTMKSNRHCIISEYEFSGTMDAGNIRDRIEKPLPPFEETASLVNRIVDSSGSTQRNTNKRETMDNSIQAHQKELCNKLTCTCL